MEDKVYVFEGKTSTEAIEKGLKELKVSKNKVDIKILDSEEKRSFFSILTPRIVKVEMRLKDIKEETKTEKKVKNVDVNKETVIDNTKAIDRIKAFLNDFIKYLPNSNELSFEVFEENGLIKVDIKGEDTGYLIGYRGEVLNSIQTILSNIVKKDGGEKTKLLVNIGGFREKREKDLQILAVKIAGTVIKTKKSITLEPMSAYERKIIHTKLQENDKVKTHSIGEEPYRKVVVSLK